MILKREYYSEIKEYVESLPESEFEKRRTSKERVLNDKSTMEQLWCVYQKDIEDYDCDEDYSKEDAINEVLGTVKNAVHDQNDVSDDINVSYQCPFCGSKKFIGHQLIRADVYVGEDGNFEDNLPGGLESAVYDAEKPYGPFTCVKCSEEFDELPECKRVDVRRGSFLLVTEEEMIQKFKDHGYSYSHEDHGYTIIGNGTRAVAISDNDYDRYFGGQRSFCL